MNSIVVGRTGTPFLFTLDIWGCASKQKILLKWYLSKQHW